MRRTRRGMVCNQHQVNRPCAAVLFWSLFITPAPAWSNLSPSLKTEQPQFWYDNEFRTLTSHFRCLLQHFSADVMAFQNVKLIIEPVFPLFVLGLLLHWRHSLPMAVCPPVLGVFPNNSYISWQLVSVSANQPDPVTRDQHFYSKTLMEIL